MLENAKVPLAAGAYISHIVADVKAFILSSPRYRCAVSEDER